MTDPQFYFVKVLWYFDCRLITLAGHNHYSKRLIANGLELKIGGWVPEI